MEFLKYLCGSSCCLFSRTPFLPMVSHPFHRSTGGGTVPRNAATNVPTKAGKRNQKPDFKICQFYKDGNSFGTFKRKLHRMPWSLEQNQSHLERKGGFIRLMLTQPNQRMLSDLDIADVWLAHWSLWRHLCPAHLKWYKLRKSLWNNQNFVRKLCLNSDTSISTLVYAMYFLA